MAWKPGFLLWYIVHWLRPCPVQGCTLEVILVLSYSYSGNFLLKPQRLHLRQIFMTAWLVTTEFCLLNFSHTCNRLENSLWFCIFIDLSRNIQLVEVIVINFIDFSSLLDPMFVVRCMKKYQHLLMISKNCEQKNTCIATALGQLISSCPHCFFETNFAMVQFIFDSLFCQYTWKVSTNIVRWRVLRANGVF